MRPLLKEAGGSQCGVRGLRRPYRAREPEVEGPHAEHGEGQDDDEEEHADEEYGALELLAVEEAGGFEDDGQGDEKDDDAGGEGEPVEECEAAVAVGLLDEGEDFEGDDGKDAGHDVEDHSAEKGEADEGDEGVGFGVVGAVVAGLDEGDLLVVGEEGMVEAERGFGCMGFGFCGGGDGVRSAVVGGRKCCLSAASAKNSSLIFLMAVFAEAISISTGEVLGGGGDSRFDAREAGFRRRKGEVCLLPPPPPPPPPPVAGGELSGEMMMGRMR